MSLGPNFARVRAGRRTLFVTREATWKDFYGAVERLLNAEVRLYVNSALVDRNAPDPPMAELIVYSERQGDGTWSVPAVEAFPRLTADGEDRFPTLPQALIDYVNDLKPFPHTS